MDLSTGSRPGYSNIVSNLRQFKSNTVHRITGRPSSSSLTNDMSRSMSTKLEDLRTCNDLIVKHGHALQRSVTELETATAPPAPAAEKGGDKKPPDVPDIQSKVKILNERATLFKITSNAMINACSEYLELTQSQGNFFLAVSV